MIYSAIPRQKVSSSDVSDEEVKPQAIATQAAVKKVDSEIIPVNNTKIKGARSIFTGRLKTHCEMIYQHTEASIE
jgi:hypothetical protein